MNDNRKTTQQNSVIINELNIRSVDRSRKDISIWRGALSAAESVYHPDRTRLYDLYDDIMLDGHLSGVVAKRIDATLNKTLCFEVNGIVVAGMDELIRSQPFRNLLRLIMETQFWGISGVEFLPGSKLEWAPIPRKHIQPGRGIISYEQHGTAGITYGELEHVWVMGQPADLGLLLKCAPYCLYKRGGLADWAEYIELFGQPVRIIKYDSYDDQTKAELKRILDESGSSLSIMIPRQADFDIKDGKQTNCDGNLQLSFIKALNQELSITVLGNTETTASSAGSGYAQSRIHLEQQYEITRSDMIYTAAMLNDPKLLKVLKSYGYPVDNGNFAFAKEPDVASLRERLAIDLEVAKHVAVPEAYWYQTYGIKRPA